MKLTEYTLQKMDELIDEFSKIATHPVRMLTNQDLQQWRKDSDLNNKDTKRLDEWVKAGSPHEFLVLIQYEKLIGAVDVGYGGDFLYNGKEWEWHKNGVFQKDWCFISDYYGYEDGALFKRVG